jgi:hypothetical protein
MCWVVKLKGDCPEFCIISLDKMFCIIPIVKLSFLDEADSSGAGSNQHY